MGWAYMKTPSPLGKTKSDMVCLLRVVFKLELSYTRHAHMGNPCEQDLRITISLTLVYINIGL